MNKIRKDAWMAVILWAVMMLAYYLAGIGQIFYNTNISLLMNLIFLLSCLLIVTRKKQGVSSVGLTTDGIYKSLKTGAVCAALIVIINGIIPGIMNSGELRPAGQMIWNLGYFIFIIALPEEVIFRGYIMTRFDEAMQNSKFAILISGILFMLIHIPYQLAIADVDIFTFLVNGNWLTLLMTLMWHIIFCFMFRKTKSIYGVIVFHGFMDWSNYIFI